MIELHLIVDVTAKDIYGGRKASCERCPIALAALRAANPIHLDYVSVSHGTIRTRFGETMLLGQLPAEARVFIANFDMGVRSRPFRFPLALKEVA